MTSTFLGLNTAVKGLMSQQLAIDTTSHNIDNASTDGYSRQRVDLTESLALDIPQGQLGTGVQTEDITRLRDAFIDSQYRDQNQQLNQAQVEQDTLGKINGFINEPSGTGISSALQNFWNAWDKLSTDGSSLSARTEVRQTAIELTDSLNQTSNQLTNLNSDIQQNLSARVTQANQYLSQIANLNTQISRISSNSEKPNDLMDQRDEAVDKLSQIAQVSVKQIGTSYQVSIGDPNAQPTSSQFVAVSGGTAQQIQLSGTTMSIVHFDQATQMFNSSTPLVMDTITNPGGQLQGTFTSLTDVNNYKGYLNSIAQNLASGQMTVTLPGAWSIVGPTGGGTPQYPSSVLSGTFSNGTALFSGAPPHSVVAGANGVTIATNPDGTEVATIPAGATVTVDGINGLQALGFSQTGPGTNFFVSAVSGNPIDASNISVAVSAPDIAAGTTVEAGTTTPTPGDGTLALATSNLKNVTTTFPNPSGTPPTMTGTIDDFLQGVISQLGIQSQQTNNTVTNQQSLIQQLTNQRQSVSGVSIDEEMANMVQFQQAYNASAKMVSTINEMLTTLMQNV